MSKQVIAWGTFMCDIIAAGLDKVAEPGVIEYLSRGIEMRLGGHPADLIIDLARINVDQNEIGFVSTIGNDLFGDFLMNELGHYRFEAFVQRVEAGTGKTMTLAVKGKDRLCHLDPAACMKMSLAHLEKVLDETRPAFFSLRPGYTNLDTQIGSMLKRLRTGPLKHTFLLLDLCAPYQKGWDYYLALLPHVDAVHGNSKEITRAAGESDFSAAARKILSLGTDAVLLTKEGEGAEFLSHRFRISQPAFNIRFVEPSGCGDAFCAGVIYSLIQARKNLAAMNESELAEVLRWGQALGAAAATEVGCVAGVTKANVQGLLQRQGKRVLEETKVEKQ